jgi:hypothetical protein
MMDGVETDFKKMLPTGPPGLGFFRQEKNPSLVICQCRAAIALAMMSTVKCPLDSSTICQNPFVKGFRQIAGGIF